MTREEAQEYAKTMTYKDAVYNLMRARSIPYRKATFIKITELLKALEQEPKMYVLDKIKTEIESKFGQCDICEYFEDYDYDENDISEYRPIGNITDILQIIDKYKEE